LRPPSTPFITPRIQAGFFKARPAPGAINLLAVIEKLTSFGRKHFFLQGFICGFRPFGPDLTRTGADLHDST
jgi:hypothetical protein